MPIRPVAGIQGDLLAELMTIPGCQMRRGGLSVPAEMVPVLDAYLRGGGAAAAGAERLDLSPTDEERRCIPDRFFPWQTTGALALARGLRPLLWMATGTGKTSTALVAARITGGIVLAVTRSMGRDVFLRDAAWAASGMLVAILVGEGGDSLAVRASVRRADRRLDDLRAAGACGKAVGTVAEAIEYARKNGLGRQWVFVVPWETLEAHVEALLAGETLESLGCKSWPILILDEQHMMKSQTARRTRAALRLVAASDRVWGLTATAVRDRIFDLYPQWYAVAPGSAGRSKWAWAARYSHSTPGEWGGIDTSGPHPTAECDRCARTTPELYARLSRVAYVVTREAIRARLPAVRNEILRIGAATARAAKGEEALRSTGHLATSDSRRGIEGALAHAADRKLPHLVERCAEALVARDKIIVVGNRKQWVMKVVVALQKAVRSHRQTRDALWIRVATGDVGVSDRQALAREFLSRQGPAALVATIDAISESIDLQDADRMVFGALPYTPGQLIQARGRTDRLGRSRPLIYEFLVAEGTIDEQIESRLLRKLMAIEEAGAQTDATADTGLRGIFEASDEEVVAGLSAWLRDVRVEGDDEEAAAA